MPRDNRHKILKYSLDILQGICALCGPTVVKVRKLGNGIYVYCWFKGIEEKYHITRQQWDEILRVQNGVCASCEGSLEKYHIDHNHNTQLIRGILCSSCNRGIGLLKDSPRVLRRAARYLERPPQFETAWAKKVRRVGG